MRRRYAVAGRERGEGQRCRPVFEKEHSREGDSRASPEPGPERGDTRGDEWRESQHGEQREPFRVAHVAERRKRLVEQGVRAGREPRAPVADLRSQAEQQPGHGEREQCSAYAVTVTPWPSRPARAAPQLDVYRHYIENQRFQIVTPPPTT